MSRDFRFSVSIRIKWPFGRRRLEFGNGKKRRRPEPLVAIPAQPSGWDPVEPAPPWFVETLRRHRDGTVYYVEHVPSAVGVASVPGPGAPAATEVIPAVREEPDLDSATEPEGAATLGEAVSSTLDMLTEAEQRGYRRGRMDADLDAFNRGVMSVQDPSLDPDAREDDPDHR